MRINWHNSGREETWCRGRRRDGVSLKMFASKEYKEREGERERERERERGRREEEKKNHQK